MECVTTWFTREDSGNDYEKWCEQLNGGVPSVYVNHTLGQRTGYAVRGCTGADDYGNSSNWHWCDWVDNGYWFNQSLDFYIVSSDFITSITCIR